MRGSRTVWLRTGSGDHRRHPAGRRDRMARPPLAVAHHPQRRVRRRDLDWVFAALRGLRGRRAAVEAMRTLGLGGLSVTMPHKAGVRGGRRAHAGGGRPGRRQLRVLEGRPAGGRQHRRHRVPRRPARSMRASSWPAALRGDRCRRGGAGGGANGRRRGAAEVVVRNRSPERAGEAAQLAGAHGRWGRRPTWPAPTSWSTPRPRHGRAVRPTGEAATLPSTRRCWARARSSSTSSTTARDPLLAAAADPGRAGGQRRRDAGPPGGPAPSAAGPGSSRHSTRWRGAS